MSNHKSGNRYRMGLKVNVFFWCAILILVPFTAVSWTQDWNTIQEAASDITSIKTEFVQEKHLPILKKPLVSKGLLYFKKPDSLRWEYISPVSSVLLSHEGTLKRYIKSGDDYTEDMSANLQVMRVILDEISHWLSGKFFENPDFETHLYPEERIELVAANKELARMIKRIELLPGEKPGVIKTVRIFESKDSYTVIRFKNLELNSNIDDSVFERK